ncbi:MAG: glycosyltransferase [Spirochaetales bacterium]|nr:glycosyltransferase [Spirochaetales bacterium]
MEPLVTAVVPSFRGSPRLESLCSRLLPVLRGIGGELILVDDGSDDDSWAVMRAAAADCAEVGCVRLARRSGQQAATLAGCSAASGRWIVTLDDDLEHKPEDIPRLLDRAEAGYELVYAVPRARPLRPLRRLGSGVFDLGFSLLVGKPRGLRLTSFRVLDRGLVKRMLGDRVPAIYVSALALRQKPRVSKVAVSPGPPAASRTSVRRLAGTFLQTLVGYGPLGRLRRGRPVVDFLPIAEVRTPACRAAGSGRRPSGPRRMGP